MPRRAVLIDSGDEAALHVVDVLAANGYTVHVIVGNEELGERFLERPVYVHVMRDPEPLEALGVDIDDVEACILISENEGLNLSLGRACKSRGVPIVVVSVRSSEAFREAEGAGMMPINLVQKVSEEVARLLKLRFTRVIPLDGSTEVMVMRISSDSKLIGARPGDLEEDLGVRIAILRDGSLIKDPESPIQQGDTLIAIGSASSIRELVSK